MIQIPFLNEIKAYGFMALAGVLTAMLGLQTWRLHTAQLNEATAVTALANERGAAAAKLVTSTAAIRVTETGLNTSASETRKVTNEKVLALTVRNGSLLKRVRAAEQAARDAQLSSSTAVAGTGQAAGRSDQPELLGQLGETDVEEATRADTIRVNLQACYVQYDNAVKALSLPAK